MTGRPQFTLRASLVAMLVVAAFFGGMALQKQIDRPVSHAKSTWGSGNDVEISEKMVLRDGTTWHRGFDVPIRERISSAPVEKEKRSRRSGPKSPLFTRSQNQK